MAAVVLAAGVLGTAGWGIWRRSQAVGGEADTLPLPPALEVISRAHAVAVATPLMVSGGRLAQMTDLATFFEVTGWGTGAVTIPAGHEADVASINGAEWEYARLIQATSLNMMALINDADARASTPPIPNNQIGTAVSVFNLATTSPVKPPPEGVKKSIAKIEKYLRQRVPLPNTTPKA